MSLPSPSPSSIVAVTGASAGIGAELPRGLVWRGRSFAFGARDEARLEDLASELRAGDGVEVDTFAADLTQADPREGSSERSRRARASSSGSATTRAWARSGAFRSFRSRERRARCSSTS
jgi:uncharacterized protein